MTLTRRVTATVLLLAGVALVFGGLTSALGRSPAGILASLAAIAGLLYAGGVWFGASARPHDLSAIIYTRDLLIAAGADRGRRLAELFPPAMQRELEAYCREALDGRAARFSCSADPERRRFEASPVRTADGIVACGILLSDLLLRAIAPQHLTPVA